MFSGMDDLSRHRVLPSCPRDKVTGNSTMPGYNVTRPVRGTSLSPSPTEIPTVRTTARMVKEGYTSHARAVCTVPGRQPRSFRKPAARNGMPKYPKVPTDSNCCCLLRKSDAPPGYATGVSKGMVHFFPGLRRPGMCCGVCA